MGFSQNARFALELEDSSAEDHPRGTSLAIDLSRALDSTGWAVSSPDNWRDVGWSFSACRDGVEIEVILSAIENDEWILQLGPARGTGLIAKILGRRPSASPPRLFRRRDHPSRGAQGTVHQHRLALERYAERRDLDK